MFLSRLSLSESQSLSRSGDQVENMFRLYRLIL